MQFTIQADGGARGNPGPAGAGAVVHDDRGTVVAEVAEFLGHATNNVAEYTAIVRGLGALADMVGHAIGETEVAVEMDSLLVIQQMKGVYKIKHPNLKPLAAEAQEICSRFKSVSFKHIPREKNAHADALANRAMDSGMGIGF